MVRRWLTRRADDGPDSRAEGYVRHRQEGGVRLPPVRGRARSEPVGDPPHHAAILRQLARAAAAVAARDDEIDADELQRLKDTIAKAADDGEPTLAERPPRMGTRFFDRQEGAR